MTQLILAFSLRGYLPLIRKDSTTHMYGLAVYVKERLPFARDFSSLCTIFDSISFNINEVLSINPSGNVLVFGDFNFHHNGWLTYSGGTDRHGELCYNLLSQMNLLRWLVNFPTWSLIVIPTVLLFWIYLFLLALVFVLQWFSLYWQILIMLLSQFPLTFHQIHNGMPSFIA